MAERPRLLVIGPGDVAWRALPWLLQRFRVLALCRQPEVAARWRAAGALPLTGDLDDRATLRRVAGFAQYVLHTAPPPGQGCGDARTTNLLAALARARILPRTLVYISTTGVYGDCGGACVDETQPVRPGSARGRRRVAAEQLLRRGWRRVAQGTGQPARPAHPRQLALLRAPGIYAADRLPLARLQAGTPALVAAEDGYTSHIHADDLAQTAALALFRARGGRAWNVCDHTRLRMGDWFDRVADTFGLQPPPRITRAEAERTLPESLLGFMRESRQLDNRRLLAELRVRLLYPTVVEGLAQARKQERNRQG